MNLSLVATPTTPDSEVEEEPEETRTDSVKEAMVAEVEATATEADGKLWSLSVILYYYCLLAKRLVI